MALPDHTAALKHNWCHSGTSAVKGLTDAHDTHTNATTLTRAGSAARYFTAMPPAVMINARVAHGAALVTKNFTADAVPNVTTVAVFGMDGGSVPTTLDQVRDSALLCDSVMRLAVPCAMAQP